MPDLLTRNNEEWATPLTAAREPMFQSVSRAAVLVRGLLKKEVSKMKSLFAFVVAALMVLSFSMAGLAYTQSSASRSQTTATDKRMEPMVKAIFMGKVVSVNSVDKTIVVKGKEGEKTFDVSNVMISGTVKPGDPVYVTYAEKEGKMVASSVSSGNKTSMNGPPYGYDPYPGYESHFYGYDPYGHNQHGSSRSG